MQNIKDVLDNSVIMFFNKFYIVTYNNIDYDESMLLSNKFLFKIIKLSLISELKVNFYKIIRK